MELVDGENPGEEGWISQGGLAVFDSGIASGRVAVLIMELSDVIHG